MQLNAILRAFRPGDAGNHDRQIEFERNGVVDFSFVRHSEQTLDAKVIFERPALLLGAARRAEIGNRLVVDGKEAHGRAILGGHVGNRRAVGHRQLRRTRPKKLHELPNHLRLAK